MFRLRQPDESKLKPTILKIGDKKAPIEHLAGVDDVEKVIIILHCIDPIKVTSLLDAIAQEAIHHHWRFVRKRTKTLPNTIKVQRVHLEFAYDNGSMNFVRKIMKMRKVMEVQVIKSTKGGR